MDSLRSHKFGLPPVVDENTEILILGSLPSDMSIAAGQYYANPANDFWRLVGAALGKSIDAMSYEDKLELLKANRIGLWDVFRSGVRSGSMDKGITDGELNDFGVLKSLSPKIRLICFNGREAAEASGTLARLGYCLCPLPSSSGANRRDDRIRQFRWMRAFRFIGTDFNQKYGLTPEPVLDDADVLSPDFLSSSFVRINTGLMPSLNDVQIDLAEILLIPQVPESVRRTFRIAKRLYLFGRFEYGFYTVSQHYAFLAMEAAILCRWTASLPNPVTVQFNGLIQQMSAPSHAKLAERFWMKGGRSLLVDGLPFPNSPTKVLRRLLEANTIDIATEERLLAAIGLRNELSHHESATVFPPSTGILASAAELINTLFDSLHHTP